MTGRRELGFDLAGLAVPLAGQLIANREGWPGEAEGLKISLAGAQDKLAQIDRRTRTPAPVGLGMPALSRHTATN